MAIQHKNDPIIHQLRAYQKALDLSLPAMTELDLLFTALQQALYKNSVTRLLKRIKLDINPQHKLSPEAAQQSLEWMRVGQALLRPRKQHPGSRKLDRYRQAIETLRQTGASQEEISLWLKQERRCRVDRSTVSRFLKRLAGNNDEH